MTYSEAHKRAEAKYRREKTTQVIVRFYNASDAAMIEHVKSQPNMQGYIKRLIREDMEKQGLTSENS